MEVAEKEMMDRLSRVPLFALASKKNLRSIVRAGKIVQWPDGKIGVEQGAKASAFYLILHGGVEVSRDNKPVARLYDGDFFGEAAMLTGKPRNARVSATTATSLFALSRFAFAGAVKTYPDLAMQVFAALADRQASL